MTNESASLAMIEFERPKRFPDLIGQDVLVGMLLDRIRNKRSLDRHITFIGPRGVGKMTIARLYSQALICEALLEDGSPCQTCSECKGVLDNGSWAYVPIDSITQGDEETIRTLIERDETTLNAAPVRIVLFQDAEHLTSAAADAALKTLERETKTVFIFLVNDELKFAGALRSRCQVFVVRPLESDQLVSHLARSCQRYAKEYDAAALAVIARTSCGFCGAAVEMLAQVAANGDVTLSRTLEGLGLAWGPLVLDCWEAILAGRSDEAFLAFESIGSDGPSRIRAMQAFLLELELRQGLGLRRSPVSPALEVLPEEAWMRAVGNWKRFAQSHSMNARELLAEALGFWRGVRLDSPWQTAFRKACQDLSRQTGQQRVTPMETANS